MEIKLSAGDTIQVPAGCNATIKGNTIVIEKREQEFKDGDVLISPVTRRIVVFKSYETELKDTFCCYCNNGNKTNSDWVALYFRHATEEEKQAFFDDLKNRGLHWNAETKTMEKVRKRAKDGEYYLFITTWGGIEKHIEKNDNYDN